jgi:serine/threonine protein kinase
MAPEIVSRTEYYGKPVDIWSAGVLLYAMVTGKFPFTGILIHIDHFRKN